MAASRWKRFAFFERHTLGLPAEVLDDLLPADSAVGSSTRLSSTTRYLSNDHDDDAVALVVTTAALPASSRPPAAVQQQQQQQQRHMETATSPEAALSAMWSSLYACTGGGGGGGGGVGSGSIAAGTALSGVLGEDNDIKVGASTTGPSVALPSQAQQSRGVVEKTNVSSTTDAMDGLVLCFVSSRDSCLVHCVDVTVRCNPPPLSSASFGGDGGRHQQELEDMDGFRGYFAPFGESASVVALAACRGLPQSAKQQQQHRPLFVACLAPDQVCVWQDAHLHLSARRPLKAPDMPPAEAQVYVLQSAWNARNDGDGHVIAVCPGLVAVGTTNGTVLIYLFHQVRQGLRQYLRIPPPTTTDCEVSSVQLSIHAAENKASVFVSYHRGVSGTNEGGGGGTSLTTAGLCCYDMPLPVNAAAGLSAPSARHDLDGRTVNSASLVDAYQTTHAGMLVTVARPDGLYYYSQTERTGVAPIDGIKLAICLIPPPVPAEKARLVDIEQIGSGYALVASTDDKSGRDAVDIYDATNKLVAFHLLLSPGHKALRAAGVTTPPSVIDGTIKGGRSSAVVLTSGGSLVSFTEKSTTEKITLLVQKNLYSAAIMVAYADPVFESADISGLYRRYAEYLYRKGDFTAAMDQYMYTIGSLETSHVIFRYLDAPKIPMLVKYLEKLRARELATSVHNELLRTCYLKLNDTEAAAAIASSSSSLNKSSLTSILSNMSNNPKEALATICSLDAQQAAEVIVIHGASLARALPRETAGVVIALCVGTYSPRALADAALVDPTDLNKMIEHVSSERDRACEPYPVALFASAFIEHPKLLRLVIAHCNRNRCPLTPSLRRTLLELTLTEWNQARRTGDTEAEKLRYKEAIAALTDSHCRDIGDYDALVIVQQAGFEEGELLLYERLQMTPMLLERYAKEGSEKSRRQMLAMCQTDPEILADVLGHFVKLASQKLAGENRQNSGDESDDDEVEEILEDIQEALSLARRQGVLPPVRIARILAGEGTGQFGTESATNEAKQKQTVPLSVALDYVGTILEESRKEVSRLTSEVEEYNQLCNGMENEIDALLRASNSLPPAPLDSDANTAEYRRAARLNIDELYAKMRADEADMDRSLPSEQPREAFWRDMNHSEDTFDTIARFFAKGVIN